MLDTGTIELYTKLLSPPDGYETEQAADGEEAVRLAKELKPDLVVMDVRMPRLSGVEATRRIKTEIPEVAVLVLTAHDDDEYVFALLQAGANGFVLKTASPGEIIRAVRDVNAGNSALDATIVQKMMSQISGEKQEPLVETLTERELEVLTLVAKG